MCGKFIIKYFSKFTNSTFEFIFMYFLEKIHKLKMITSCAYEKSNLALSDGCHVSFAHIQLKKNYKCILNQINSVDPILNKSD